MVAERPVWVGYGPSLDGDERLVRRENGRCVQHGVRL
jgi:hypothetical protein